MKKFLIRCSSLSSIMPDPASYPREEMSAEELEALKTTSAKRTPEQVQMLADVMDRTLSEGAKEHMHKMVKRYLIGYAAPELGGKEVRKGVLQEGVAIGLLSAVTGELYDKNIIRFENEFLSGEPDLIADDHGNDTKCPWSWEQFPLTSDIARKYAIAAGYEWQNRGYMLLTGLPRWGTSYCMVDTPSELIPPWESGDAHDLHGVPVEARVTTTWFDRDEAIERKIERKCRAAQSYAEDLIQRAMKEKGCSSMRTKQPQQTTGDSEETERQRIQQQAQQEQAEIAQAQQAGALAAPVAEDLAGLVQDKAAEGVAGIDAQVAIAAAQTSAAADDSQTMTLGQLNTRMEGMGLGKISAATLEHHGIPFTKERAAVQITSANARRLMLLLSMGYRKLADELQAVAA
ncbi:MAG: hypothetical protein LBV14_11420 [Acidovorax sp.]|jgi:hypothetical protein|nr:hypothetical protein [Acidovorax sp.]